MTKLPVLSDNTRDAHVIGYADSEAQAAAVFTRFLAENDASDAQEPRLYERSAVDAHFTDIPADDLANGFYEPY